MLVLVARDRFCWLWSKSSMMLTCIDELEPFFCDSVVFLDTKDDVCCWEDTMGFLTLSIYALETRISDSCFCMDPIFCSEF